MGFKVKSWNVYRSLNMAERVENFGGGGGSAGSLTIPWAGKIIVASYQGGVPTWWTYDPATDVLTYGGTNTWAWRGHSPTFGWSPHYRVWADRYLFATPSAAMYYAGYPDQWWGWDANGNFLQPQVHLPTANLCYASEAGHGVFGGEPTLLCWQNPDGVGSITRSTLSGTSIIAQDNGEDGIYISNISGAWVFHMRDVEGRFAWHRTSVGDVLYPAIPFDSTADSYIAVGNFGGGNTAYETIGNRTMPHPSGGAPVYLYCQQGSDPYYWALSTDPLSEVEWPYGTTWDYRLAQDGGYTLDEHDLDGFVHGATMMGPKGLNITKAGDCYYGVDNWQQAGGTVWVLDAPQPAPRARTSRKAVDGILGWVGDYAIGTDLALRHVLPFPDLRKPSGTSMPPQERNDGKLLSSKEVFHGSGVRWSYLRDVVMDLSSYTHGDDWWFPGENPDQTYSGFWHLFAGGGPTTIGLMPDYMWGAYNPLGTYVMRFLGQPTEDFNAEKTHTVRSSSMVANTAFAARPTGTLSNLRMMLCSGFDGLHYTFCASGTKASGPPSWKAAIGTISGQTWNAVKEFGDGDRPNIGESGWTVWSVVPIPKCTAMPGGGWLVGATLYFEPWGATWEYDVGTRDTYFVGTTNPWVPAKPGWRGPLNDDNHAPILLSAYDEWTAGRSLYGPDALLVYDAEGNFVTHLNSLDLHAPDGREIMVTGEKLPKLLYRIYRWGTYSDFAEGYGQYHHLAENEECQVPLYAVYNFKPQPGAGDFLGFVEGYQIAQYAPKDNVWRWGVPDGLYDWEYPKRAWNPPASAYCRSGRGGGGVTMLSPTGYRSKLGVRPSGRS